MKDACDLFWQIEYWMDKGSDYFITSFNLCSYHDTLQAIDWLESKYNSKDFSYRQINWGDVCRLIDRDCLDFYFPFWFGELYMYEYDTFLQICWKEKTNDNDSGRSKGEVDNED